MIAPRSKKQFQGMLIVAGLVFGIVTIDRLIYYNVNKEPAHIKTTAANLLRLHRQEWRGYPLLQHCLTQIKGNWTADEGKKATSADLVDAVNAKRSFANGLDQQIVKIRNIAISEESLKLGEQSEQLREYAEQRRRELDDEFQKRAIVSEQMLQRELQEKATQTEQQIQKYRNDVEAEQHLNLVNLQLRFLVVDLLAGQEGANEHRSKIQSQIEAIKDTINQKVVAERDLLNNQLIIYGRQRRAQVQAELDDLKLNFETELANDLTAFQVKIESDYNGWHENRIHELAKAITVRQEQKNQ
ncbi:MAG TPA: hypothetical protein DDW65_03025 [Firmicutes bacterium]|jgi:hypothetical protein|nr:hypothetical protein [Bacillota bacterium]